MLRRNYLLEKLASGRAVLGTWAVIPSLVTADIIAASGLDFMIIDREHGPITFETAQQMAIACESREVSPVMRVGDIERSFMQNALDVGMHGIQVPNVGTSEHARTVVHLAKYPPIGDRGFSPFTRAGGYSLQNGPTLTQRANASTAVILNIEGEDAIGNLDQILEVEHVDIVFVGLFDLSKALGIPGDVSNPRVTALLHEVTAKAHARHKHVGTIATNPRKVEEFLAIGLTYIVYLVDCEVLRAAYASVVEGFHTAGTALSKHQG